MRLPKVLAGFVLSTAAVGTSLLGVTAPAHASSVVCDTTFDVAEASWDVPSGCQMQPGDHVVISAGGSIWAGVWFTGNNGPQGWTNIAGDAKFPSPSSRAYSLLANVDGRYQYVGTGTSFTYTGLGSPLHLRINDDTPGNGSGAFVVRVQLQR
jgi:hypothetical protein